MWALKGSILLSMAFQLLLRDGVSFGHGRSPPVRETPFPACRTDFISRQLESPCWRVSGLCMGVNNEWMSILSGTVSKTHHWEIQFQVRVLV